MPNSETPEFYMDLAKTALLQGDPKRHQEHLIKAFQLAYATPEKEYETPKEILPNWVEWDEQQLIACNQQFFSPYKGILKKGLIFECEDPKLISEESFETLTAFIQQHNNLGLTTPVLFLPVEFSDDPVNICRFAFSFPYGEDSSGYENSLSALLNKFQEDIKQKVSIEIPPLTITPGADIQWFV